MDAKPAVFEIELPSFQADVVERSREVPVVVLFWTEQVAPAAQTKQALEALCAQFQGKFALALSDIARDQTLAQQLRVQGIPSIRVVHNGQLVEQLDGPQGDAALRALVEKLTMSGGEMLHQDLAELIASGDWDAALAVLQEAINAEPHNPAFKVEWADVLVQKGDLEDARTVVATIAAEVPDRERPVNRLELAEEAAGMGTLEEAIEAVEAHENDLEARYRASVILAVARRYEEALDNAMAILQKDRTFRDDIGRTTMIRIMSLLGKDSDVAKQYRRRMFAFMH